MLIDYDDDVFFSNGPLSSFHKTFLAFIFSGYIFLFFFDGTVTTNKKTRRYLNDFILCLFIHFYFSYVVFLNINKFEIIVFYNVIVLFSLFLFFDCWSLKNYLIFSSLGFFVAYFFENPFLLR